MKKIVLVWMGFIALMSLSACNSGTSTKDRITVIGSSTVAPLMNEIGKEFEKLHPEIQVEVQAGGSSKGLMDVRQGVADIGMVSRKLKVGESDVKAIKIAIDGLAIIIHKDNPLNEINKQQVVDIYLGKVSNWKQLDGNDLPVTVVSKAEGRSTLEVFTDYFGMSYKDIKASVVIGDNQQGIQTVNGNPGAIGYVSIGTAEYEARNNGANIKLLTLDGTAASTENVRNGSYSISRELNLIIKGEIRDSVRSLLNFSKSKDIEHIYKAHSFIAAGPMTDSQLAAVNYSTNTKTQ